jgi:hypothetical protein
LRSSLHAGTHLLTFLLPFSFFLLPAGAGKSPRKPPSCSKEPEITPDKSGGSQGAVSTLSHVTKHRHCMRENQALRSCASVAHLPVRSSILYILSILSRMRSNYVGLTGSFSDRMCRMNRIGAIVVRQNWSACSCDGGPRYSRMPLACSVDGDGRCSTRASARSYGALFLLASRTLPPVHRTQRLTIIVRRSA